MPPRVRNALGKLECLQHELQSLNLDDTIADEDIFSVTSRSTKATSIISNQSFNSTSDKRKSKTERAASLCSKAEAAKQKKIPFSSRLASTRDRIENSALILECLNDMLIQENDCIEAALVQICDDLGRSIGMNSFEIPKSFFFSPKKK